MRDVLGPVCNGHNCSKRGPGALHDDCNESMIKSVAQAMLDNGLNAAGYTWINLGRARHMQTGR